MASASNAAHVGDGPLGAVSRHRLLCGVLSKRGPKCLQPVQGAASVPPLSSTCASAANSLTAWPADGHRVRPAVRFTRTRPAGHRSSPALGSHATTGGADST